MKALTYGMMGLNVQYRQVATASGLMQLVGHYSLVIYVYVQCESKKNPPQKFSDIFSKTFGNI